MNYTTETNARFVLLHKALCVQHGKNIYLKKKQFQAHLVVTISLVGGGFCQLPVQVDVEHVQDNLQFNQSPAPVRSYGAK